MITEFDEELWIGVVDRVVVSREGKVSFVFKEGMEVEWDIQIREMTPTRLAMNSADFVGDFIIF